MADSTIHEKSHSIQFKKCSNNLQYCDDNNKFIYYNRSNKHINLFLNKYLKSFTNTFSVDIDDY